MADSAYVYGIFAFQYQAWCSPKVVSRNLLFQLCTQKGTFCSAVAISTIVVLPNHRTFVSALSCLPCRNQWCETNKSRRILSASISIYRFLTPQFGHYRHLSGTSHLKNRSKYSQLMEYSTFWGGRSNRYFLGVREKSLNDGDDEKRT